MLREKLRQVKLLIKENKSTSKENFKYNEELITSNLNLYRNLSPIIDRKLLEDLKWSTSFKEKRLKGKVTKLKKVIKSPRNYLNPNISNVKSINNEKLAVSHKTESSKTTVFVANLLSNENTIDDKKRVSNLKYLVIVYVSQQYKP